MKELRSDSYCIAYIPRDTVHQKIHEWLTDIPTPSQTNATEVLKQLRALRAHGIVFDDDDLESRLWLLIALFDYVEQPTADALRKQLDILHTIQPKPS